ncbi:hypothetical protein [Rubrivirga sp.]|uniref:hypothetical protein n=1 Tax=Rubrivirga sp. TaxID=1885344 RepID=UPI003C758527
MKTPHPILKSALVGLAALPTWVGQTAHAQEAVPPPLTSETLMGLLDAFDLPDVAVATLAGCDVDEVVVAVSATLAPDVSVTPQTSFEAASLSKPASAWPVLSIAVEGARMHARGPWGARSAGHGGNSYELRALARFGREGEDSPVVGTDEHRGGEQINVVASTLGTG